MSGEFLHRTSITEFLTYDKYAVDSVFHLAQNALSHFPFFKGVWYTAVSGETVIALASLFVFLEKGVCCVAIFVFFSQHFCIFVPLWS